MLRQPPLGVAATKRLRPRAVFAVDLFGVPADYAGLAKICEQRELLLIADAAQSFGGSLGGSRVGALAPVTALSFFPAKPLGCYGDGGAVLTNDAALYERMKMITNHGGRHKYYNEIVGVNSRLDALQAAILRVKLRHLDVFIEARCQAADRYDALLAGNEALTTPHRAPYSHHVFHQYTLRIAQHTPGGRDALSAHLKAKDIPHGVYYPVPLHRLPVFAEIVAMRRGEMTETERAAAEVVSLPMHTELRADQQQYIAEAVLEFVEQRATV